MSTPDDNMLDGSSAVAEISADVDSTRDDVDPRDRRQAAIVTLGRRAIAPPDISLLMQDAAALLAETLDTQFSGVAQPSPDESSLVMQLFATDCSAVSEKAVTQNLSLEKHLSMVGFALSVAHPIAVDDLAEECRFSDALLKRSGIRSGITCPLLVADRSFGALGVFSTEQRSFTKTDVQFAETIAHLITTAAARQRAERQLNERNNFTDAAVEIVDALVLMLDKDGKIQQFNRACQNVTGFAPAEIRDRTIWNALLVPEEVALVRGGFEQLRSGKSPVEYETYLLTKHGARRRVAWAYTVQHDPNGSIRSIVATGIDVTAQRQTEQQLKETQERATKTQQTLDELMERIDSTDLEPPWISDSSRDDPQPGGVVGEKMPDRRASDRRSLVRRAYPYKQRVAPLTDGRLPAQDGFMEVDCRDISSGGFSYFADVKPDHKAVVVALGSPPSLTYLSADVLRSEPTKYNGRPMFLVGCRYTGRANYPHGDQPAQEE